MGCNIIKIPLKIQAILRRLHIDITLAPHPAKQLRSEEACIPGVSASADAGSWKGWAGYFTFTSFVTAVFSA
jgi:hypothetical protein